MIKYDTPVSVYKGKKLNISLFGASHSEKIGVDVKGLKGQTFDLIKLQQFVDRRKPSNSEFSTKRKETDKIVVTKGVKNNRIGKNFQAVIFNNDQKSKDYENLQKVPRPSHADFVAWTKYGDKFDYRGGGKFSGRMTAPLCIVGGICKQLLLKKGIDVCAYISKIGAIKGVSYNDVDVEKVDFSNFESTFPTIEENHKQIMFDEIEKARMEGDSIGGVIECVAKGLPIGLGEYMFDSVEGVISRLAFAVPAVKGIEFGKGFSITDLNGSQANDAYYYEGEKVKTKSNNNGGILGGMTNGMPLTFRVAVKPTPSIAKEQDTIDLIKKENTKLIIKGRHDACIVPRAVPVIEAITAIALYDLI